MKVWKLLVAIILLCSVSLSSLPICADADLGCARVSPLQAQAKIYSGGAIDSSGRFSITADEFMEELIGIMNSDVALTVLENISMPLDPDFTYYFQDEDFYILQYSGVELGAVSFLKNGNPSSGDSQFDSVGIQVPCYYGFSTFFLIDACTSAIFLTAPACIYNDAMMIFAALIAKEKEQSDAGKDPYFETSTELFSYSVEAFLIDETDNTWQYLFSISQV